MDVDDEEDLVPEITKAHFEEAMKFARRLVGLGHLLFDECVEMVSVEGLFCAAIDAHHLAGLCPTTTSRSTRCSRRLFSRAVVSATTSGEFSNSVYLHWKLPSL